MSIFGAGGIKCSKGKRDAKQRYDGGSAARSEGWIATYHANYTKLYIIDLSLRYQSETVSYTPHKVGEFVCQQELVRSLEAGVSYILVLTSR